ncbi:hypothetical protein FAP39_15925 [Shimia litoralis]|uniref:Uncharacterized protein n=1 Tax=Shimia litoralis TaxID=420403 RepID=A0A4V6F0U3_9RHOB|nr:hypothetical protein [Shimia litoralis]TKZ16041.1 hypothetical protein FAP39_15925 [Shimia litoralis]
MKLPRREYYTVHEAAARWGYTIADVAAWSAAGHFDVLTGIPPAMCGEDLVAGEVTIAPFDILPVFRRCGTGPLTAKVRRVRTKDRAEFTLITDPADGIEVSIADLLITGKDAQQFEEKNNLFHRMRAGNGSASVYDWEGMLQALALRIHQDGIPATQAELVAAMQEWFVEHSDGNEIPDERSIRRRITPIWRALTKDPISS